MVFSDVIAPSFEARKSAHLRMTGGEAKRAKKKGPMAMASSVQFLRVSEQVRGRSTWVRGTG
jgi:hypothetical protein